MRPMLIAAAVLCSTCALAEPVSLVSGDDYAPYADRKLPEGGMTTEIVSKAFAAVKQEVKVAWLPWARGFDEAKNGTYAGTFPYLKNAERERDFLYSNLLIKLQDRAFVKAGNAGKFDFSKPESLAGTKICLPLGWATTPKLAEMLKSEKIKKESPKDISTCVKMVANDRADYFVSDEAQGLAALETGGVPKGSVVMLDAVLADNSLFLIAGKSLPGSKDLIVSFNKGMEIIQKDGTDRKSVV